MFQLSYVTVVLLTCAATPIPKEKPTAGEVKANPELLKGVEDGQPVRSAKENLAEFAAYCYLVAHAKEREPADLAKAARQDIDYAQMYTKPAKCRGEIVHLEGRLRRLFRLEAPMLLKKEGIPHLYEAWLFDEVYNSPICVILTEVGPGLKQGDRLWDEVSCDAYYFKLYRYETAAREPDGKAVVRYAPLLIGRTMAISKEK